MLLKAAAMGDAAKIIEQLGGKGLQVDAYQEGGTTPLMAASQVLVSMLSFRRSWHACSKFLTQDQLYHDAGTPSL